MKRKLNKTKRQIEYKYLILIILIILTIVLAILSFVLNDKRNLNPVESLLKDTVSVVQKIIYKPFKYIGNKIDDAKEKKDIFEKYDKILLDKEKYDLIKTENIELKRQIEALKEELAITNIPSEYEKINATVINRNVGYWYNTITIDKGKSSGIKKNMIVINNKGLVGKIIKTSNLTSTIKLITTSDVNSKISVTIEVNDNLVHGLLSSYDFKYNYLLVEGISNTIKIEKNSRVTTSGYGGIYPSGILIGYVESTTSDVYDLTKFIKVKPSVEFDDINYVSVLKRVNS